MPELQISPNAKIVKEPHFLFHYNGGEIFQYLFPSRFASIKLFRVNNLFLRHHSSGTKITLHSF